MHILETPRPCYYCGKPAIKMYGPNSDEPRCTTCQARIYREHGATMQEWANAITTASKDPQDIDTWEPGHAH